MDKQAEATDRARKALHKYQGLFLPPHPEAETDKLHLVAYLLTDLFHYCEVEGVDFGEAFEHGRLQFEDEIQR